MSRFRSLMLVGDPSRPQRQPHVVAQVDAGAGWVPVDAGLDRAQLRRDVGCGGGDRAGALARWDEPLEVPLRLRCLRPYLEVGREQEHDGTGRRRSDPAAHREGGGLHVPQRGRDGRPELTEEAHVVLLERKAGCHPPEIEEAPAAVPIPEDRGRHVDDVVGSQQVPPQGIA
jgi:hypothetical protein